MRRCTVDLQRPSGYSFLPYRGQHRSFKTAAKIPSRHPGCYDHEDTTRYNNRRGRNQNFQSILGVFTFRKLDQSNPSKPMLRKIQIIATESNPMAAILNFHSSKPSRMSVDIHSLIYIQLSS